MSDRTIRQLERGDPQARALAWHALRRAGRLPSGPEANQPRIPSVDDLDAFTAAYVECALWSSTDPDSDDAPLDQDYEPSDLAPETLLQARADCGRFQRENESDLENGQAEQGGHDFWLTRNGHGAGFWDGDWPEPEATRLTEASEAYGEVHYYPGDPEGSDGEIVVMIYGFSG